jgi:hypothetical protein
VTVFRTDIAQATGLAQSVMVNNTADNPVPITAAGTLPVREQGVVRTQLPAPITGGGGSQFMSGLESLSVAATASALLIRMTDAVMFVRLYYENAVVAEFQGSSTAFSNPGVLVVPLPRPVRFDRILCSAVVGGGGCSVSWVGAQS